MARLPRILIAHQPHHVLQRGYRGQIVFDGPECYRHYLADLHAFGAALRIVLHAWCLTPRHAHLLLTPGDDPRTLSILMRRVARRATRRWNARRSSSDTLWEARIKARAVDGERHLLNCCRYIERHPVRAGLADSADAYPWSSYRARLKNFSP